jgi:Glycosyltransferase family 87
VAGTAGARLAAFGRRAGNVGALWLFWLAPALIAVLLVRHNADVGVFGFDFRGTVLDGGRAVLDGRAPYPSPGALEPVPSEIGSPFVYPPLILWLAVPLALLPVAAAEVIWTLLLLGGVAGAMLLAGVRDWRCLGIALLSVPVLKGLTTGNVTLLLLPLVALAWYYRDHRWAGGAAVGLAVALKLFLWPLLIWLLATRRFRPAAVAAVVGAGSVFGSWALIGFQGLLDYPELLRLVDEAYAFKYISISALSESLGASQQLAHLTQYLAGAVLLLIGVLVALRGGGDRRSFSVLIVASLVLTPIVWAQNFALLFIPIALRSPALGALWIAGWAAFWFEAAALRDAHALAGGQPGLLRCAVVLGFATAVLLATGRDAGGDRLPRVGAWRSRWRGHHAAGGLAPRTTRTSSPS